MSLRYSTNTKCEKGYGKAIGSTVGVILSMRHRGVAVHALNKKSLPLRSLVLAIPIPINRTAGAYK